MSSFSLDLSSLDIAAEEANKETSMNESAAGGAAGDVKKPICVLVIGMAGSGKTSLMQRLNLEIIDRGDRAYYLNLDPATSSATELPFAANIDIRDTVQYKEVMKQYGLGPNGAILTSLNLFATRFDQVISLIESKIEPASSSSGGGETGESPPGPTPTPTTANAGGLDYVFIDTPGQIEVFTWSAGGQIIHELLASAFPTIVLYVVDTPRCVSPTTFMSNMLYACSVLYKSQLPLVCAFNKTDVAGCEFALEWMTDFESFQEAVDADGEEYMGPFNRSLSLVMDEFYSTIRSVGVSAVTGEGVDSLFEKFAEAAVEFRDEFLPEMERRKAEVADRDAALQEATIKKIREDIRAEKGGKKV